MIATLLILAQMPFITANTAPNPRRAGEYITTIYSPEMASDPFEFLTPEQRLMEAEQTGVNSQFYGGGFNGGIRTVAPAPQLSTEQRMREEALRSTQMQRDLAIQKSLVDQKIDASEYRYKLNTLKQGEQLLGEITSLNPDADDYIAQRAALSKKFPLGVQHQPVARQLELLDNTHEQVQRYNDSLKKSAADQAAREAAALRKDEIHQSRTMMAKYGMDALAQYEDLLAKDPDGSPLSVAAKMVDAQEQQSRISQLQELGVDPKQFYTPTVNGESKFDTRRADALIKTYPTSANAAQSAASMEKISAANFGVPYEEWDPNTKAMYDFHGQQLQRYQQMIGQKAQEKPKVKSAASFFGK